MKSALPKPLHTLAGRPMIDWSLEALKKAGTDRIVVVVGAESSAVEEHIADRAECVLQKERLGTAHAVLAAKSALENAEGDFVITHADMPLYTADTYDRLFQTRAETGAALVLGSAVLEPPPAFGRIVRNSGGNVRRIVEDGDATPEEREITEVNIGLYCFENSALLSTLERISNENAKKEYYLTDAVELIADEGRTVRTFQVGNPEEGAGVNDRADLARVEAVLRRRVNEELMQSGVTLRAPETIYIDGSVEIGRDTVIHPGCWITGQTTIGDRCEIGPYAVLQNCKVADSVTVLPFSHCVDSQIGAGASVGPYARLRPGACLGPSSKVGNFVEIKKSVIGEGSKVNHLTYIGDTEIGQRVNIGAGTITANYDGVRKHKTTIEDEAHIGSGTVLVAPVRVGKGAVTGAGAIVTRNKDVPPGETVVGMPARPLKKRDKSEEGDKKE